MKKCPQCGNKLRINTPLSITLCSNKDCDYIGKIK